MVDNLITNSIELILKRVMERSAVLGVFLGVMIILVSLYWKFDERCHCFVENNPRIVMTLLLFLLGIVLLLIVVLVLLFQHCIAQIEVINENNQALHTKVDEVINRKNTNLYDVFIFLVVCVAAFFSVCMCLGICINCCTSDNKN